MSDAQSHYLQKSYDDALKEIERLNAAMNESALIMEINDKDKEIERLRAALEAAPEPLETAVRVHGTQLQGWKDANPAYTKWYFHTRKQALGESDD